MAGGTFNSPTSDTIQATAPATPPAWSREDLVRAFERQRAHQWAVRRRTPAERVETLRGLKRAIVARREDLLDAMHADFRKNRTEAELSEIQLVLTELNEAIARVPRWMRPVRAGAPIHTLGTRSRIEYQPRGVVLIIAAWNYPFALLFAPLVAAVAAGNCAILRPSEKVPRTSDVARRIVDAAFAPEEVTVVGGDRTTARTLLELPFDHVFFTGSTPVGRAVMAAAAPQLSSLTLELGGKSPAIVDETADVAHAARSIMWGKFVNAGQTCVAPDYALVHVSRHDEFLHEARRVLAAFYGPTEEARQSSGDYCRMIDEASWARVARLIDEAVRAGATIEAGGIVDRSELYIAPTILSGVDARSPVMADEIFGPVLPVLRFDSREEVFALLRDRPKPLAMYIFSTSERHADEIVSRTAAGGTVVNNCLVHLVNPRLPFGGVGQSGFGSYHGRFGFETFSHARAVAVQGRPRLSALFHPPYERLRTGWLGAVTRMARRWRD
jgi:aldehyde dehydrogenase (NAD+)